MDVKQKKNYENSVFTDGYMHRYCTKSASFKMSNVIDRSIEIKQNV